jgi:hypothetical protein
MKMIVIKDNENQNLNENENKNEENGEEMKTRKASRAWKEEYVDEEEQSEV